MADFIAPCFLQRSFIAKQFDFKVVSIKKWFLTHVWIICRTQRIGQEGIAEIQNHKFFINDQWEWDTIKEGNYCRLIFDEYLI